MLYDSLRLHYLARYGASVTVLLVNALLRRVVLRLVTFERHASKTSAMVSRFTKLFVSTALNIGVVMLLVNAHLVRGRCGQCHTCCGYPT